MRILVVDDESVLRKTFIALLQHKGGHEVLEASDGAAALSLLEREEVDLIVSDYHMPEMDGDRLLAALRLRGNKTPFLLHTSDRNAERELEKFCATHNAVFRTKGAGTFLDAVNGMLASS